MSSLKSLILAIVSFAPVYAAALLFGLGDWPAVAMGVVAGGSALACVVIYTMWADGF